MSENLTYYQRHKSTDYPIYKLRSQGSYYRNVIKKLENESKSKKLNEIDTNFIKAKIAKFKVKEQEINDKLTTMKTHQT